MANNQSFDPIGAARQRYPGLANQSDQAITQFLGQPDNFRNTFPEYGGLSDDTIQRNMMKYGPPTGAASPGNTPVPAELQGPAPAPDNRSLWQKGKDWLTTGLASKDSVLTMMGSPNAGNHAATGAQALAHQTAPKTVPPVSTTPIDLHGFAPAENMAQVVSDQTSPLNLATDAVLFGGGAAAKGIQGAADVAESANAAKWLNRGAKAVRGVTVGTNAALAGQGAVNTAENGAKTIEDPGSASNWLNTGLSLLQTAGGAIGATKGFYSPQMTEPNSFAPQFTRGQFADALTDPARGTPLNLDLAQTTESPTLQGVKSVLNKMPGSRGVFAKNAESNLAALSDRRNLSLSSQPEAALVDNPQRIPGTTPVFASTGGTDSASQLYNIQGAAKYTDTTHPLYVDYPLERNGYWTQPPAPAPIPWKENVLPLSQQPWYVNEVDNATKNLGDYLDKPVETKYVPWGVSTLLSYPAVSSLFHGEPVLAAKQAAGALAGAGALNLAARGMTNPGVVNYLTTPMTDAQRVAQASGLVTARGISNAVQQQQK